MKLTAVTMAVLVVGALSAPHLAGSASCDNKISTCLRVQKAADAFSSVMLPSSTLGARGEAADDGSEAASAAKRGISELATMMAMTADNPKDFLARLGMDIGAKPGKVKREASPRPWCWQRRYMCWKRDLSSVRRDKKKRETEASSCWYPGNLCWRAKQAADAVLKAAAPQEKATKSTDKREAGCRRPEHLCKASEQDLNDIQALARSISSALD